MALYGKTHVEAYVSTIFEWISVSKLYVNEAAMDRHKIKRFFFHAIEQKNLFQNTLKAMKNYVELHTFMF